MDPANELRVKIVPLLLEWEQQLSTEHPDVHVSVYDSPTGNLTEWQGHDIGIDCLLKNAPLDDPDNLALSVGLCHLDKAPLIFSADVTWGHPSGYTEASLLAEPVVFSAENLELIVTRLPELYAALQEALRRGRPSNW